MTKKLPKTPQYHPKDLIQNEIIENIKKKVETSKNAGRTSKVVHKSVAYEFPIVTMSRDNLYYNLQNDRTLTKTKEWINDQIGIPDDYFKNTNSSNTRNQKDYHDIIFSFIPSTMVEVLTEYKDQRDAIYITEAGLVANGNTRLACFRELPDSAANEAFRDIECIVIPPDYDWRWIRSLVDQQDNTPEFKTNYPWYARAERLEMDFEEDYGIKNPLADESDGGPSKIVFKQLSDAMKYSSPKEAKHHLLMLKYAREFISKGWHGFEKLSDLDSGGAESNLQAFDTLTKGCSKNIKKIEREYLSNEAYAILANKRVKVGDHAFPNVHRAISQLFTDTNIARVKYEINKLDKPVDIISGEDKQGKTQKFIVDRYKDKSDELKINESLDETLVHIHNDKLTTTEKRKKDRFKESLNDINRTLKASITVNLQSDTNLDDVDSIINSLEKLTEELKSKVKAIVDSRN